MSNPRSYHYRFTSVALLQIAFTDPLTFFAMAGSPEGYEHVASIWSMVCADVGAVEAERMGEELQLETRRIRGFPTLIITLPTPQKAGEAFMAGFVLLHDIEAELDHTNVTLRYFTLELVGAKAGSIRTRLCEWNRAFEHVDHGEGPEPTIATFVDRIAGKI